MSRIVVVDENDAIIGTRDRGALLPGDIYRVTVLWLTNPKGEVLISKRPMTKEKDPGAWSAAVAGTIEEGEDYDDNIVKEIFEELGISVSLTDLTKGTKIRVSGKNNDFFSQRYFLCRDIPLGDFRLPPDEVDEVRWVPRNELEEWHTRAPEDFVQSWKNSIPFSESSIEK